MARTWRGVIEEYRARLPVTGSTPVITLGEGGTPLVRSDPLSAEIGCEVWLKYEGANPTGSFKDRGMTVAISKAVEEGSKAVVCASTGNTSASAAAYAGKAGLTCAVLVPKGRIAPGKMAGALVHGARVLEIEVGLFDGLIRQAVVARLRSGARAVTPGPPAGNRPRRPPASSRGARAAVSSDQCPYRFQHHLFIQPLAADRRLRLWQDSCAPTPYPDPSPRRRKAAARTASSRRSPSTACRQAAPERGPAPRTAAAPRCPRSSCRDWWRYRAPIHGPCRWKVRRRDRGDRVPLPGRAVCPRRPVRRRGPVLTVSAAASRPASAPRRRASARKCSHNRSRQSRNARRVEPRRSAPHRAPSGHWSRRAFPW